MPTILCPALFRNNRKHQSALNRKSSPRLIQCRLMVGLGGPGLVCNDPLDRDVISAPAPPSRVFDGGYYRQGLRRGFR